MVIQYSKGAKCQMRILRQALRLLSTRLDRSAQKPIEKKSKIQTVGLRLLQERSYSILSKPKAIGTIFTLPNIPKQRGCCCESSF